MAMPALAQNDQMPPSRAGSLNLLGGALCLNFCNTTSGRGTSQVQEHLRSFTNLLAWARHAGAIDHATADWFEKNPPLAAEADRVLRCALGLRSALQAIFSSVMAGARAPEAALAELNGALADAMSATRVEQSARGFSWGWQARSASPESLLWPVARSAAELLTTGDLARIRVCPGCFCGWMFLDKTRNGRRRWCEMEICGSRNKMRRYHQRRRDIQRVDAPF
jgi:predicted RNA-binding Zn ribbon-like protein